MDEINSVKELFARIQDGDELTIYTGRLGRPKNATVRDDSAPEREGVDRRVTFGRYANCDIITVKNNELGIHSVRKDGISVRGEEIRAIVNITQQQIAGERELINNEFLAEAE